MGSDGAADKFFELGPLVDNLIAAGPALFQVVENRLACMELTLGTIVVSVQIVFVASGPFTLLGPGCRC